MKIKISKIICLLAVFSIALASLFAVPAFADSASIALSKKTVNVGDTVTVTAKYNSSLGLIVASGSLSYNTSVLQYVSGGDSVSGASIRFYKELNGQTSTSVSITFKAIAAGSSNLSVNYEGSDGNSKGTASSGTTVNVVTPAPSSNANLASLTVSEGSLSPSFSAKTTDYTVKVKNGISQITIKANAADGKSTVSGAGTFTLKEGDNKYTLTVSAPSGAKKSYNITVRLMTAEETSVYEKEQRANDPLLVTIDTKDYHIVNDLSTITAPSNLVATTEEYKGGAVNCYTDSASEYKIFYLSADDNSYSDYFFTDEKGGFNRLPYIVSGGQMYIVKENPDSITPSDNWFEYNWEILDGLTVSAYKSSDTRLSEFYVVYCYFNGEEQYYRFDTSNSSIQRYPDFERVVSADNASTKSGLINRFKSLSKTGKITVLLIVASVVCVVVLIILFIILIINKRKDKAVNFEPIDDTSDFDMISFVDTNVNDEENE